MPSPLSRQCNNSHSALSFAASLLLVSVLRSFWPHRVIPVHECQIVSHIRRCHSGQLQGQSSQSVGIHVQQTTDVANPDPLLSEQPSLSLKRNRWFDETFCPHNGLYWPRCSLIYIGGAIWESLRLPRSSMRLLLRACVCAMKHRRRSRMMLC